MALIKLPEESFFQFLVMQVKIYLSDLWGESIIPDGFLVVRHMKDSSKLKKGKYHTWTEYWEDTYSDAVEPENKKCTCCQRFIKKTKSNYFVVGHVETESGQNFIYPVCNECNVKLKNWRFLANKNKLRPLPTDF